MKAIIVHISGSKRGKTEVFSAERITVGTELANELRFDPMRDRGIVSLHAEIELKDCEYTLRDKAGGTFVNARQVEEVVLQDGDLIEFGTDGPKVRFRTKPEPGEIRKPFRQMLEDSMTIARESALGGAGRLTAASTFFKELAWEVVHQSYPSFRIGVLVGFFLILAAGAGIYRSTIHQKELQYQMEKAAKRLETLEARRTVAEKIIKDFGPGVCLIQGSYYFGEVLEEDGVAPVSYEYTGTGFLVKEGKILTNKHIAVPWWRRPGVTGPLAMGFNPKFLEFRAFFPGIEGPFPLEVVKVSEVADVAIVKLDTRGADLPVIELDTSGGATVGEPVVVIGYPAGISAILARMEKSVVDELVYARKLGFLELAAELSKQGLIRPLSTQGHITDVLEDRMVFDAMTTIGGSGGPVFNHQGKVIGITYGIFTGFTGSNFAIPARYATELLESPGEHPEELSKEAAAEKTDLSAKK